MQRFLLKTFFFSLPIFAVVIGVNYYGDAAKLFHLDFEYQMVDILKTDSYVTDIDNYDERVFQREWISRSEDNYDIVVLGSSRSMLIRSRNQPGLKLFNSSVSGAGIEDLIAIFQIYATEERLPEEFIICIDPWMFNVNKKGERWKSIASYYNEFKFGGVKENVWLSDLDRYKQLLSFSYFQSSVELIDDRIFDGIAPTPTNSKFNKSGTKLTDGSLVYGERYRNLTPTEIQKRIDKYLSEEIFGLSGFEDISEGSIRDFQRLVSKIQSFGCKIKFFLAPYPLRCYETILNSYPKVADLEELLNSIARKQDIRVIGSYDPRIYNFSYDQFYDGMHCKEEVIDALFAKN